MFISVCTFISSNTDSQVTHICFIFFREINKEIFFPLLVANGVTGARDIGVDFIKIREGLSCEAYFAIANDCKKQDITFVGHVTSSVTAAEASDAGQKSIGHFNWGWLKYLSRDDDLRKGTSDLERFLNPYSKQKAALLFERFAKNGTWFCPTLAQASRTYYITYKSFILWWQSTLPSFMQLISKLFDKLSIFRSVRDIDIFIRVDEVVVEFIFTKICSGY